MSDQVHYVMEAHHASATLYLRGSITTASTLLALALCQQLAPTVRVLRLDIRAADLRTPAAMDLVAYLLWRWASHREGTARITGPAISVSTRRVAHAPVRDAHWLIAG